MRTFKPEFSTDGRWARFFHENEVDFSADGRWVRFFHLKEPDVVEVRETSQWRRHATWKLEPAGANRFEDVRFSDDGQYLAAALGDGSVRIFDVPARAPARLAPLPNLKAKRLVWWPKKHTLAVGCLDGRVWLWDLVSGQPQTLEPEAGNVWALAISPDASTLAVGTQDGVLKLVNLPTRREVAVLRGHLTYIGALAFSPDGRVLVSGGGDDWRVWRAAVPENVAETNRP